MLVAGVVLGVLLGPAVLDRFAPDLYDQMFVGSGDTAEFDEARAELDAFNNDEEKRAAILDGVIKQYAIFGDEDASMKIAKEEQLIEINNRFADEQDKLVNRVEVARLPVLANQHAHREKLQGMATMMLLLIVLILTAEAILSPQRDELESGKTTLPPALSRLITIRYGLAAGWLMLMLAQPTWLKNIDLTFGVLLLVIVLIAGLVPLGKPA